MKKTAVIGASANPMRYAYLATQRLVAHGHEVVPLGIHNGSIGDHQIVDLTTEPNVENIDTVTMYINPSHQAEWSSYILSLHPRRIIFNPGTENPLFEQQAKGKGIMTLHACTLVLLGTDQY